MWDKLLEGRTVHPRYAPRSSVPAEGRSRELGPRSGAFRGADCNGGGRKKAAHSGVATCIAENLRASYADLVREPVPERFMEVLARLTEPRRQEERLDEVDRVSGPRGPSLPR